MATEIDKQYTQICNREFNLANIKLRRSLLKVWLQIELESIFNYVDNILVEYILELLYNSTQVITPKFMHENLFGFFANNTEHFLYNLFNNIIKYEENDSSCEFKHTKKEKIDKLYDTYDQYTKNKIDIQKNSESRTHDHNKSYSGKNYRDKPITNEGLYSNRSKSRKQFDGNSNKSGERFNRKEHSTNQYISNIDHKSNFKRRKTANYYDDNYFNRDRQSSSDEEKTNKVQKNENREFLQDESNITKSPVYSENYLLFKKKVVEHFKNNKLEIQSDDIENKK